VNSRNCDDGSDVTFNVTSNVFSTTLLREATYGKGLLVLLINRVIVNYFFVVK
jgi:hypothetical protein